jgi:hypothetical protein
MVDWIKDLKKPLNIVIDKIEKLGGDKSGTNAARKIIRSSMKQIDINLKKIKYYSTRYKPKRKPGGIENKNLSNIRAEGSRSSITKQEL